MLILTVGFERKCDLVGFLVKRKLSEIAGMSERCVGDKTFLEIYAEDDIRELLSYALADYILIPLRRMKASFFIETEYPFVNGEEKGAILNSLPYSEYKPGIQQTLYDYIKESDMLDIPGFVRFRIPGFIRNIIADTSRICESFLKKREYDDMVSFLRYHISNSASRGITTVTFSENGGFHIVYPDGRKASPEKKDEPCLDMVLGMLMVTVPEKIKVYNKNLANDGVIEALEAVFGEKIEYCD